MQIIDSCMDFCAEFVETVSCDPSLACPPRHCSLKQRRSCLDACDWLRAFASVTAGHLGGAIKTSLPAASSGAECSSDAASVRAKQQRNWARYVLLRDSNPSEAAKFLAKLLRPNIATQIRLKHKSTGELLSTGEALTAILDDITSRPLDTKVLVTDSASSSHQVTAIRALGAVVWIPPLKLNLLMTGALTQSTRSISALKAWTQPNTRSEVAMRPCCMQETALAGSSVHFSTSRCSSRSVHLRGVSVFITPSVRKVPLWLFPYNASALFRRALKWPPFAMLCFSCVIEGS